MTNTTTFTSTSTLTPAQRAVQTRRKNALAKTRRATALKAWDTRRRNEVAAIVASVTK